MRSVLILFLLFWAAGSSAQAPQPKAEPERAKAAERISEPRPAGAPVPVEVVNQPTEPQGYQDPCRYDKSDSRSDLCAQWTAANGAALAAHYAGWQLWAAAAGMLGLLVTIWLTSRAVKAAQESVRETRRIGEAQVRCYLTITGVTAKVFRKNCFLVTASVLNAGQTPATLRKGAYRTPVGAGLSKPHPFQCYAVVPAGKEIVLPPWQVTHNPNETPLFGVMVDLETTDVFEQKHKVSLGFFYSREWKIGETVRLKTADGMLNILSWLESEKRDGNAEKKA